MAATRMAFRGIYCATIGRRLLEGRAHHFHRAKLLLLPLRLEFELLNAELPHELLRIFGAAKSTRSTIGYRERPRDGACTTTDHCRTREQLRGRHSGQRTWCGHLRPIPVGKVRLSGKPCPSVRTRGERRRYQLSFLLGVAFGSDQAEATKRRALERLLAAPPCDLAAHPALNSTARLFLRIDEDANAVTTNCVGLDSVNTTSRVWNWRSGLISSDSSAGRRHWRCNRRDEKSENDMKRTIAACGLVAWALGVSREMSMMRTLALTLAVIAAAATHAWPAGYPQGAIVADPNTPGLYWFSQVTTIRPTRRLVAPIGCLLIQALHWSPGRRILNFRQRRPSPSCRSAGRASLSTRLPIIFHRPVSFARIPTLMSAAFPGQSLANNSVYDVFLFNDAGTPCCDYYLISGGNRQLA